MSGHNSGLLPSLSLNICSKPCQILWVVQTGLGPGRLGLPAQIPAELAILVLALVASIICQKSFSKDVKGCQVIEVIEESLEVQFSYELSYEIS